MVFTKLMLMVVRRKFVVSPGLGELHQFSAADSANHWQIYIYSTRQNTGVPGATVHTFFINWDYSITCLVVILLLDCAAAIEIAIVQPK